jgi:hypothetical protein
MQLKAKVVISVYNEDSSSGLLQEWHNMLNSLRLAASNPTLSIDQVCCELKKFDAEYDGTPYIFFYDERKYELWLLKYSSVCNVLDTTM